MGSHSIHEALMANKKPAEEEFTFLNQMPPLLFDDDFSFCSGLNWELDLSMQESWSYLPNFFDDDPFSSYQFLPDPLDEMWSGYGNGFDDLGQETSWFESFESFCNGENGHGGDDKSVVKEEEEKDENCKREEEKAIVRSSSKLSDLSREMISKYFYLPITQAAKELNVGLTGLKKRCREVGIVRWPHRKLASLETLINNVKQMSEDEGEELVVKKMEAIEKLEKEKKLVEDAPNINLERGTRKLRQSCFKARYKKKRRLMTNMAVQLYQSSSSSIATQSSTFTSLSGSDASYDEHQTKLFS